MILFIARIIIPSVGGSIIHWSPSNQYPLIWTCLAHCRGSCLTSALKVSLNDFDLRLYRFSVSAVNYCSENLENFGFIKYYKLVEVNVKITIKKPKIELKRWKLGALSIFAGKHIPTYYIHSEPDSDLYMTRFTTDWVLRLN